MSCRACLWTGLFRTGRSWRHLEWGASGGVERLFWETRGVWSTAVGYSGGRTTDPNYASVCKGTTGHAEVVRIVFLPSLISFEALLEKFWQSHDPTQGMRQGNDVGEQYRSAIFVHGQDQRIAAESSMAAYASALKAAGLGPITTQITEAGTFYFAEDWHQQYLAKNPGGYCSMRGTGVAFE